MMSGPLFDAPVEFDGRIFVAYPTLSSDITPKGREEYQQLVANYSLPNEHIQAQLVAFAAAKLMVEGLRRAGRDLSRIRFVEGLEELYAFKTGVTPPLTFGPNRRIGALGAHVVAVDIANKRHARLENGWFDLK
jgi:ABC-type branched-subunit amino acid transport system substrate-binding protein